MGYKGDSLMDCGYFVGGDSRGLLYIPPSGSSEKAGFIPWDVVLFPNDPMIDSSDNSSENSQVSIE